MFGRVDVVLGREALPDGLVVLRLRDGLHVEHPLEHQVAARPRGLRVLDRVVHARRGDHPGQERRLVRGHVHRLAGVGVLLLLDDRRRVAHAGVVGAGALVRLVAVAEVGAHGGLDPVGAVAEVDRVQVLREDLLLRPLALEVVSERGLAELLEHGAVALCGQRVLHELLRDGRAALGGAALQDVLDERARDAGVVHSLVAVEAAVLDRDHRVLDVRRDLVLADKDAVLVAGELGDLTGRAPWRGPCSPSCRRRGPSSQRGRTGRGSRGSAGRSRRPSASRRRSRSGRGPRGRRSRAPGAASSAWAFAAAARLRSSAGARRSSAESARCAWQSDG